MNRLLELLPPYERTSKVFQEIMNAEQIEFNKLNANIADIEKQLFIDTATWGLEIYEKELGIETDIGKPLSERRSNIKAKLRGYGTISSPLIKIVVGSYTNGGVDVTYDGKIYVIFNDIKGIPSNMDDVYKILEDIKPAHLDIVYKFIYTVWKELIGKTWVSLSTSTWDELKTRMWS